MKDPEIEVKNCKCGSNIRLILKDLKTKKWHVQCWLCNERTPNCKTKKDAIISWNGTFPAKDGAK